MNKKGAIGLAINTIVVVVIAMVILASGIVLMRNMIGGAEDIKTQLDAQTETELERLLIDEGKKVALPLHTVTLEAGGNHVFGLGILNIGDSDQFSTEVSVSKIIDDGDDGIEGTVEEAESWLLYDTSEFTIAQNEHLSLPILVSVPTDAKKGTYIFNVEVYQANSYGDNEVGKYDNTKKFYVTIE